MSVRSLIAAALLVPFISLASGSARGQEPAGARRSIPGPGPPLGLPALGIGYEISAGSLLDLPRLRPVPDPVATRDNPLYVRIEVKWADISAREGEPDWSEIDTLVDRFRAASHEPILNIWGGPPDVEDSRARPPLPSDAESMAGWENLVRQAAVHFRGRVRFFQIGQTPDRAEIWNGADPAKSYAFLLKKTAVIVRAEAPGAVIVLGGLSGPRDTWLRRLYAEGAAPYVDVVSFRAEPGQSVEAQCERMLEALRAGDPSAALWIERISIEDAGADSGGEVARRLLSAFDAGASAVFFDLPVGARGMPEGADVLVRIHSALAPGAGRIPAAGRVAVETAEGEELEGVRAVAFHEPSTAVTVIALWSAVGESRDRAVVRLSARRPGPPVLYDPVSGAQSEPEFMPEPGGARGSASLGPSPRLLIFREGVGAATDLEETEALEVSAERGITADEVIAKYREFQAAQDARLSHYSSDAMINLHFRIAGASRTIDVGMAGSFFYEPRVGPEWELRDYFLNGNRSRWKEFPELPLIQPEKVMTLPLDITFDRSYRYEYAGEGRLGEHDCYILDFEPVDPQRTLYRGRVWIDKNSWARVRVASIQTRLEPPFLSSEERTTYAPVAGPGGEMLWVLDRIDGQQIYSASGRNFIVLRDVVFSNHRLNEQGFAAKRAQAYQSNHQILRDTDQGLRYVVKNDAGERVVKEGFDTNQLFGLVGVISDPSLKQPIPLAGINYFDYDFRKTGIQANLFFAGPLLSLNATDPNLGESGFDLGADLFLSALGRTDRDFRAGDEITERNVLRREQSLAVNLGREVGEFAKLRASYQIAFQASDRDDDTDRRFVLPRDTLVQTSSLFGSFSRSGYEVTATASYSVREDFEFWGDPCQKAAGSRTGSTRFFLANPPDFCTPGISSGGDPVREARLRERRRRLAGDDFDPAARGFWRYEAGAAKEFFLPSFQKIRVGIDAFGGSDLDRFSRYAFDRFGAPVKGFAGSGIRFDAGAIIRAAYVFNLANLIRFEASVDQARVRMRGPRGGTSDHTGVGLAANVLGPWKTVWQLEYGYALRSDIAPVEGDHDLLLVVLKLF